MGEQGSQETEKKYKRLIKKHLHLLSLQLANLIGHPLCGFVPNVDAIFGLEVLDGLSEHGLLKGPRAGHMLGTTFFPKLGWSYTIWGENGEKLKSEELRNNVWVRALEYMAIPTTTRPYLEGSSSGSEGEAEKGIKAPTAVRAMVTVSHFTSTKATDNDKASKLPFVSEPVKRLYCAYLPPSSFPSCRQSSLQSSSLPW